jgi:hypothetical protein
MVLFIFSRFASLGDSTSFAGVGQAAADADRQGTPAAAAAAAANSSGGGVPVGGGKKKPKADPLGTLHKAQYVALVKSLQPESQELETFFRNGGPKRSFLDCAAIFEQVRRLRGCSSP